MTHGFLDSPKNNRLATVLLWAVALVCYCVILYRTAWVGDDAFITLRTIDNFVHGNGLRWNVNERVQVYTHPLWLLLFLPFYALTREPFFTTIGISIALSFGTVALISRLPSRKDWLAPLLVLGLSMSRAFVDYSTSGLENPLSHLLAALFFIYAVAERPNRDAQQQDTESRIARKGQGGFVAFALNRLRIAAIVAGLATLNRHDSLLLFAPSIWVLARHCNAPKLRVLKSIGLGAIAPLSWTLFSLAYYGFPFPNTAYAKLNVTIPRLALIQRGLEYVVDFAERDPLSALLIVVAFAVVVRLGTALERAVSAGILLYVVYVVSIGGDFMAGRFFSTPVLLSALCLIARAPTLRLLAHAGLVLAMVALMFAPRFPLWLNVPPNSQPNNVWKGTGIVDERLHYFPYASLAHDNGSHTIRPWHQRALAGLKLRSEGHLVLERGAVGYEAYFAGPSVHFIDNWALCDPLLARIPYRAKAGKFRMGHFERKRPPGYQQAIEGDASQIQNEFLSRVYRDILMVTRGPLFAPERMRAIYRLNTGKYTRELKKVRY